ncbi:uncharacterized protein LOC143591210 [Bidens hawaiensis]|uniref:uncharacterized protein LOC143591210 n=1 Tax=Bidens hawaiensis TaxID=980011 RepID=UPI00404A75E2
MRCKKHYTDHSSTVGVCASCLRERLFCLLQSQSQTLEDNNINSEVQTDNSASSSNNKHNGDRNRHYSLPDRRFFSTPQVAPVTGSYNPCRKKHRSGFNFSLLSNLFRSKKRSEDSNPRSSNHRGGYRKKQAVCSGGDDRVTSAMSGGGYWKKQQYCSDRGMSPVRISDCDGVEDEFGDGVSGYESRKQTPVVRRGGGGGGNGKSVSGISFCLSPLVRVSPCRNWNQKGVVLVDCGEFRSPVRFTGSYCGNRSRKVADYGRFVTNR